MEDHWHGQGSLGSGHSLDNDPSAVRWSRAAATVGHVKVTGPTRTSPDRTTGRRPGYAPSVRIVTIVGTRPQLIKAAALSPVLRARHEEILVDTGQHYDEAMAGVFFRELGLPKPDHSIAAGGGSHAEGTGAMLVGLEPIVAEARPDAVLVYGDTNSTLAGSLVAAKLTVPIAHVEAGLRSYDRRMPEEINRIVSDHLVALAVRADAAGRGEPGGRGHPRRGGRRGRPHAGPGGPGQSGGPRSSSPG